MSESTNIFHNDLPRPDHSEPSDAPAGVWDVPLEAGSRDPAASARQGFESEEGEVKIDFVASSTTQGGTYQAAAERALPESFMGAGGSTYAPGGPSGGAQPLPGPNTHMFQLAHYQKFFDVDTTEVIKRIVGALIFRKDLFAEIEAKPDLYGPFWLSTTAIFLMAMISNALDWIATQDAWSGDLQKIIYGASIMYGYVFGGGLLLWVWLKVISLAKIALPALWCIYGYSMAIWLPVTLLAIYPRALFLWVLCLTASTYSGIFLVFNLKQAIHESLQVSKVYPTLIIIFAVHQVVAVLLRLFVFTYNLPDSSSPDAQLLSNLESGS